VSGPPQGKQTDSKAMPPVSERHEESSSFRLRRGADPLERGTDEGGLTGCGKATQSSPCSGPGEVPGATTGREGGVAGTREEGNLGTFRGTDCATPKQALGIGGTGKAPGTPPKRFRRRDSPGSGLDRIVYCPVLSGMRSYEAKKDLIQVRF